MEIKEFTAKTCKQLAQEVTELLKPLAEKYGLTLRPAGGKYSDIAWTGKFEFKLGNPEKLEENSKKTFEMYADIFGLKPSDYGKLVRLGSSFYKIAGIKTSAHKRNIIIEKDGKRYITTPEDVIKGLARGSKQSGEYESMVISSKDIGTLNLSDLEGE